MNPIRIQLRCLRCTPLFAAAAFAWLFTGCGDGRPARVPVSGKVLIDGQPLTYGYIRLVPDDARPAGGKINPDGTFTLTCYDGNDGCVPGTHKVSVVAVEVLSSSSQKWHAPKQYIDPATSAVTATVGEPTDNLVIELSWQGGKPFIERFGAEGG
jgi:hypothetical protein